MRILYITQWFDPEPNVIKGPDFVRALERAGHKVTVVTGFPNYPTGKIYPGYKLRMYKRERLSGVEIRRLPLIPSHSQSSIGRALNFLSFFISVLIYGTFRGSRYDLVYVYHPPITVGLAAALFCPIKKLPFILEIQDLWPDTVMESGMAGTSKMFGLLSGICKFVYRRAARIIVQSFGIESLLTERGVPKEKISVIRNWAIETAPPKLDTATAAPAGTGRKFRFVYGGNIGMMQALDRVIEAAKLGQDLGGKFELLLFGDGVDLDRLRQYKEDIGADNVRFLPRVSRQEARDMFADADVLVLHLANKSLFAATIPSKTQFYLACGKPILAGVSGEAADLLRASGSAVVVPPEDVKRLAQAMREMSTMKGPHLEDMGTKGKAYYDRTLSFDTGTSKTIEVIESLYSSH